MKLKIREVCATVLALLAAQGLFAVNVSADAQTEKGRIRLAERDVLMFADNGTLTVNAATTVELLMVGGGGGGGVNSTSQVLQGGAGGGGGGVVHKESLTLMPGDYSIVIGEGGAVGENGGNTTISKSTDFILTAYGGGAGANNGGYAGKDGGSGGGSTLKPNTTDYKTAGQPVGGDNLGFAGGVASHQYGAGGGGGATAPGETPSGTTSSTPGKGGDGYACAIVGTNVWYAGGGAGYRSGGGKAPGGVVAGGKGGGGACNNTVSEPGVDGLGGGGCGGSKGGKGVVIVSFASDAGSEKDTDDFLLSGGDKCIPLLEDTVLVFRQSGSLKVMGSGVAEVLLVGGGGGGGTTNQYGAGGGGAGGVIHRQGVFLNEGTYDIVVGAGGEIGADGQDSSAFGFRALGGGAGSNAGSTSAGHSGGSGGGAAYYPGGQYPYFPGATAVGASYGNMGHNGGGTANPYGAGGGGGAGAPGEPSAEPSADAASIPGNGGDGYPCSITGAETWYGGGGTGYRGNSSNVRNTAVGGRGGGGESVAVDGDRLPGPGTDGLGGGGCGGAKGGSGVVIVRYHKATYATRFEGAEGGVMTQWRSFRIHTFTEDGTFTMPTNGMVEVLLVGGGGGGGECLYGQNSNYQGGAGGGAGGVVHVTNLLLAAGSHAITIGAGGGIGTNGEDTVAFDRVAHGGGAGARYDGRSTVTKEPYGNIGSDGGSGGGSTHARRDATMASEPIPGGQAVYAAEGNLGHDGGVCTHVYGASGGGGAGGVGGDTAGATGSSPGCGGIGIACSITGREVYYAGGGAGYRNTQQADGGLGGGGACERLSDGTSAARPGEDGLGGGGCGGAVGGKGVVIIRYCFRESPGMVLLFR